MRKIINYHIEGWTRASYPRAQDLQSTTASIVVTSGLQILDTRMGFPNPSHNMVIDSIHLSFKCYCLVSYKLDQ